MIHNKHILHLICRNRTVGKLYIYKLNLIGGYSQTKFYYLLDFSSLLTSIVKKLETQAGLQRF